jgi:YHS domain-containing protein
MSAPPAAGLRIEDSVNDACPWSGKPVAADSLALYRGQVVGFCNPGCRDKFESATAAFDAAIAARDGNG